MRKPKYIIWDTFDNQVHRGPWTRAECKEWISWTGEVLMSPEKVEQMFKIKRFHYRSGRSKFGLGLAIGVATGVAVTVAGVLTDRIVIVKHEEKN